jgi:hypothetical protein
LLLAFSWLMRRAYSASFCFQELIDMILEGFFTASKPAKRGAPPRPIRSAGRCWGRRGSRLISELLLTGDYHNLSQNATGSAPLSKIGP